MEFLKHTLLHLLTKVWSATTAVPAQAATTTDCFYCLGAAAAATTAVVAPLLFLVAVAVTVVAAPNAVGAFIAADAVTVVLSMLGPTVAAVIIAMVPIAGGLQFVVSVLFDRSILLAAAAADELINYWQQPCLWHCLETGEQCIDSMVYCCID